MGETPKAAMPRRGKNLPPARIRVTFIKKEKE